jgi:predicted signal transduction protein with EAL and GGDEF domain
MTAPRLRERAVPATASRRAPTPAPALPPDEPHRLARLLDSGLAGTAASADPELARIVELAAAACGAPMAVLSCVDAAQVRAVASSGCAPAARPRAGSPCARTIVAGRTGLVMPDTAAVPWFDPTLLGAGQPAVRAYAGVPLPGAAGGSAIGALCVLDTQPRGFGPAQLRQLQLLAASAAHTLELRRQLRVATHTDRLTGLPNWFHFEQAFEAAQPPAGLACFVRLKAVNQINSAHGFRVADALIRQAAQRLAGSAEHHGAQVARIKRGLFLLFFPATAEHAPLLAGEAAALAAELSAVLAQPYAVGELAFHCPTHLGVASYPQDGHTLDEVVNAADAALQLALERDEPVAFYDRAVGNATTAHYRLEPQLRAALERNEFVNLYQPQVDLASGRLVGVEALVRWRHPQRGLLPPSEFIPALEATGLIREAGRQILLRAMADWKGWHGAGLPAPRVAVNVAAAQLRDGEFLAHVREALDAIGNAPGALGVEVTESVLIGHMGRAIDLLGQVRALGVPVAIDDFGTGYSSLSYLVTLPVDEVKIDRSFVARVATDPAYRGIVATCVALARNLRLQVVAEGVETVEQARTLRSLRCDVAQGFLYGVPVSAEALAARLRSGA